MKRPVIILAFILLAQIVVFAQSTNKSENIRINQLLESARKSLYNENYGYAINTTKRALTKAERIEDEQLIWEAKNLIGEVHLARKEYDEAVLLFLEMSINAEKIENFSVSANGYFSLANTYSAIGAFAKATETYNLASKQFDNIDYELGMVEISLASGYNDVRAHKFDEAEIKFKKLLDIALKDSIRYFEFEAYDALIELYTELDKPKEGILYAKKYYDNIKDQGDPEKIADLAYHISLFYKKMGNDNESSSFLEIAIDKYPQNKSIFESGEVKFKFPEKVPEKEIITNTQYANKLEQQALTKINETNANLQLAQDQKLQGTKSQESQQLSQLEHEILLGGEELNHSALETEYAHQDLLIAHHEYENKERQAEIIRYKQQAEIHRLEKENWEKTKKISDEETVILEQDVEIKNQQKKYYITLIVIALVVILALGFEYMRIRRLNKLLAKQQKTIELSNIELKASNTNIRNTNKALHKTQQDLQTSLTKEKEIRKKLERTHTELKETHQSLIQAEKMSALGMLTAGIAHELKNPINFISNGIQLIEETSQEVFNYLKEIEGRDEEIAEHKQDMHELIKDTRFGTVRIQEIVEGLRVYSRKDAATFQKASITQIMDAALLILKPKYKHKADIVRKYDDNIPDIECFQGELNQVFINIIGNGVDALDKHGTITAIINQIDDSYVRVIIQDDGSGIPDDVKKKMFDPLFTTKTESEGTGLGLSITADIIKKHNGKLQLKTKLDVGTAFIITLPINQKA